MGYRNEFDRKFVPAWVKYAGLAALAAVTFVVVALAVTR